MQEQEPRLFLQEGEPLEPQVEVSPYPPIGEPNFEFLYGSDVRESGQPPLSEQYRPGDKPSGVKGEVIIENVEFSNPDPLNVLYPQGSELPREPFGGSE